MNCEAFAIGSEEHELLGLVRLTAPAIADRCGGEEVVSGGFSIGAFDLAFESPQEGVLDGGEVSAVAVPSLGLLRCPFGFRLRIECYCMRRYGAIDGSAFQHDGAAPHSTGDGYQAEPDAWHEAGARANERGIDVAVLMMRQLASLRVGHVSRCLIIRFRSLPFALRICSKTT